ncbi:MAG TPA: hypothetical protein VMM60_12200 [Ilumatobacter sp.]|nr:hypothetical protein [Ilumatobacter sp.]
MSAVGAAIGVVRATCGTGSGRLECGAKDTESVEFEGTIGRDSADTAAADTRVTSTASAIGPSMGRVGVAGGSTGTSVVEGWR